MSSYPSGPTVPEVIINGATFVGIVKVKSHPDLNISNVVCLPDDYGNGGLYVRMDDGSEVLAVPVTVEG